MLVPKHCASEAARRLLATFRRILLQGCTRLPALGGAALRGAHGCGRFCLRVRHQPNLCALLIGAGAWLVLIGGMQSRPVGAQSPSFQTPQFQQVQIASAVDGSGGASPSSVAVPAAATALEGKLAQLLSLAMLQQGHDWLAKLPNYSATFCKQERVDGELRDAERIYLKMRHEPYSVYMRWLDGDDGREVLFIAGDNDGRMRVKKEGRIGALLPTLNLDPQGSLAMAEARHPVTDAGLLKLTAKTIGYRKRDLSLAKGVTCRLTGEEVVDSYTCYCFVTQYASPDVDSTYRKSVLYIDKKYNLPVCVRNYTWPEQCDPARPPADEDTLIELYTYKDLNFDTRLADNDFNPTNPDYRFKR